MGSTAAGVAGPLIINRFLDSQGEPGALTAAALHVDPVEDSAGTGTGTSVRSVRVYLSRSLMAVLLGYGVYETLTTAAKLVG